MSPKDVMLFAASLGMGEKELKTFDLDLVEGRSAFLKFVEANATKRRDQEKKRREAFALSLTKDDDLGLVVRAHIHIENLLEDFILQAAPNPNCVNFKEMDFSKKVRLALVLGINVDLEKSLQAVGKLRNRFAHQLDMRIGRDAANSLIDAIEPSHAKQDFLLECKRIAVPMVSKERTQMVAFFIRIRRQLYEETNRALEERAKLLVEKIAERSQQECQKARPH